MKEVVGPAWLQRMVGYGLLGCLSVVLLYLCVYVKSWWDEPLGLDGIALWFVLMLPMPRFFPVLERLMSAGYGEPKKPK